MRILSFCLWLVLLGPGLAYTQTQGDTDDNGSTENTGAGKDAGTTGGTETSEEEEPECD